MSKAIGTRLQGKRGLDAHWVHLCGVVLLLAVAAWLIDSRPALAGAGTWDSTTGSWPGSLNWGSAIDNYCPVQSGYVVWPNPTSGNFTLCRASWGSASTEIMSKATGTDIHVRLTNVSSPGGLTLYIHRSSDWAVMCTASVPSGTVSQWDYDCATTNMKAATQFAVGLTNASTSGTTKIASLTWAEVTTLGIAQGNWPWQGHAGQYLTTNNGSVFTFSRGTTDGSGEAPTDPQQKHGLSNVHVRVNQVTNVTGWFQVRASSTNYGLICYHMFSAVSNDTEDFECNSSTSAPVNGVYYWSSGVITPNPVWAAPTFLLDLWGSNNSTARFTSVSWYEIPSDSWPPTNPTAPAVESHGIASGSWTNQASPTFTCTGAHDGKGSGVAGYYVYWGTNSGADPLTAGNYQNAPPGVIGQDPTGFTYSPSGLSSNTTYYLRTRTKDNAGNVATSAVTLFTYLFDGTPPTNPTPPATESHGIVSGSWTNQANPTFTWSGAGDGSGSGVAGYYVYWGTNSGADPSTLQSGTTYSPNVSGSNTTYYLRVKTKDNASNVASAVTLFTYPFDGTPPTNPTVPAVESHGIASGSWTNQASPTFTWSGAADSGSGVAGYLVYWGTDPGADPSTFQSGTTYSPSGLSSNTTYYLRAKTKDNAGNVAASAVTLFTYLFDSTPPINPTPPAIESHGIVSGSWTNQANPTFTWSGAGDGSGSGVAGYLVYWGTNSGADPSTFQSGNTYSPTGLSSNTTYYLRVKTKDNVGLVTASAVTLFVYKFDNTPPINPTPPAIESHGIVSGSWTSQASPTFTWSGAGDGTGSGVAGYYVYWGPNASADPSTFQSGTTNSPSGLTSNTTYYLRVKTKDNVGLVTASAVTLFVYKFDNTPPINPTPPAIESHGIVSGSWTNQANPTFTWSGAGDGSGSGVAGYLVYWGTNSGADPSTFQSGNTYSPTGLSSNTTYYLRVKTKDNVGLVTASAVTLFVYKFDNTPPTNPTPPAIESHGVVSGTWTSQASPTFTWSGAGDGTGSGVAGYYVYWGPNSDADPSTFQSGTTNSPSGLTSNTTYYLRVKTKDNAGNVASAVTLFVYRFDGAPPTNPTPPAIEGHGIVSGTWTSQASPTFTWSGAGDGTGSGVAGYYVYWGPNASADPSTFQSGTTNSPSGLTSNTTYYLRVKTKDNAGNVASAVTLFVYRFDGAPPTNPTPPAIEGHGIVSGTWTSQASPTFTWSGAGDGTGSGVAGYYVYWGPNASADPSTFQSGTTNSPSGLTSNTTYYLRVKTKDNAGNVASAATLFVYRFDGAPPTNPTPPAIEGHGIVSGTWTSQASPTFTWSGAGDGTGSGVAGYYVYWGPNASADPSTFQSGTTNSPSGLTSNTIYYLRVKTKDNAGNVAGALTLFVYRFDSAPPTNPTPPAIESHGIVSGTWTKQATPTFTWSGAGDGTGSGVAGYYVYWGVSASADPQTGGTFTTTSSFTPTALAGLSTHYLIVKTKDQAGNITPTSVTIFVYLFDDTVPSNPLAASLNEVHGVISGTWTSEATPSFSWDAPTGSASGIKDYFVYWGTDAEADPAGPGAVPQVETTFTRMLVTDDTYYLRLRTRDNAGNLSGPVTLFTYRYDGTGPTAPHITFPGRTGGQ